MATGFITTSKGRRVGISVDIREAHAMLAKLDPAGMDKRVKAGFREAGKIARTAMASEAPPGYDRMRRKSNIQIRQTKRDRPGIWVKYHAKKVYFKHMVLGGTKAHGPRATGGVRLFGRRWGQTRGQFLVFHPGWNKYMGTAEPSTPMARARKVKGVDANPVVDRAFAKADGPMERAMMDKMMEGL